MLRVIVFLKNVLILFPITIIFYPLSKLALFVTYFNYLLIWIYKNKKHCQYSTPFTLSRDHDRRYKLYEFVLDAYNAENEKITYLEFGVADGDSYMWWLKNNKNESSHFIGFDTFEGLPEKWGAFFKKGDMSSDIKQLEDERSLFVKGLFQNTLNTFISEKAQIMNAANRKMIHMDADLYSSTLFVLSQLYPFLKKGDIIFFDEFNVPLHEFKAFREFTQSFYIELYPIGFVNNFYQTVFIVK
ncbi:MAG: class I SAM-dependent methyltransferase [Dysgonomonas sp.]